MWKLSLKHILTLINNYQIYRFFSPFEYMFCLISYDTIQYCVYLRCSIGDYHATSAARALSKQQRLSEPWCLYRWLLILLCAHMEYFSNFDLLKTFGYIESVGKSENKFGKDLFYIIRARHILSCHLM